MTDSTNSYLSHAEQIFKELVWDPMIKAGETFIETEVPFLALPVIKQLDEAAIQTLADYFFTQMCLFVDVSAIKLMNPAHEAAYNSASLKLRIIAIEKGITSANYISARDAALDAMSAFTQFAR